MSASGILKTSGSWIQKRLEVCGGDACIRETRIPVWSVIAARRRGISEQALLTHFVTELTSEDLQAVSAYYAAHTDEVDAEIRANEDS